MEEKKKAEDVPFVTEKDNTAEQIKEFEQKHDDLSGWLAIFGDSTVVWILSVFFLCSDSFFYVSSLHVTHSSTDFLRITTTGSNELSLLSSTG